jgi:hypothetical protein
MNPEQYPIVGSLFCIGRTNSLRFARNMKQKRLANVLFMKPNGLTDSAAPVATTQKVMSHAADGCRCTSANLAGINLP